MFPKCWRKHKHGRILVWFVRWNSPELVFPKVCLAVASLDYSMWNWAPRSQLRVCCHRLTPGGLTVQTWRATYDPKCWNHLHPVMRSAALHCCTCFHACLSSETCATGKVDLSGMFVKLHACFAGRGITASIGINPRFFWDVKMYDI